MEIAKQPPRSSLPSAPPVYRPASPAITPAKVPSGAPPVYNPWRQGQANYATQGEFVTAPAPVHRPAVRPALQRQMASRPSAGIVTQRTQTTSPEQRQSPPPVFRPTGPPVLRRQTFPQVNHPGTGTLPAATVAYRHAPAQIKRQQPAPPAYSAPVANSLQRQSAPPVYRPANLPLYIQGSPVGIKTRSNTQNATAIQPALLLGGLALAGAGVGLAYAGYRLYRYLNPPRVAPVHVAARDGAAPRPPRSRYPDYMRVPADYDSDADEDWTPRGALVRRNQRLTRGDEADYPMERTAQNLPGRYTRYDLPTGPYSVRPGRASQPFVQTRVGDYGGAQVGVDYDDIVRHLNSLSAENQEDVAYRILQVAQGAAGGDFSDLTAAQQRAVTHLLAITQIAEEHSSRTPGSAAFARAALRTIADGNATFSSAFNRASGAYVPARHGGTGAMRQFVSTGLAGEADAELVAGNLSDSD